MTEDEKLVENIDKFGKGLNKWEKDFVADMVARVFSEKKPLSDGQRKICERIERDRIDA